MQMQLQVENPMVLGPYYDERTPACTCPHCGEAWHAYLDHDVSVMLFEGTSITTRRPLSDTGKYCAACVVEAFSTDQALLEWFDQEVDCRDFVTFFLGQKPSMWDRPVQEEAELFVTLLQTHEPERFGEALRRWVLGSVTSSEYEAFENWLMETK